MGRKRVVNVCERLRMKSFLYIWGSMSFSIFHFGQSLDIATWSPWKFTHFGSFWQSSKLCPSSPHPAQTALLLHEFLVCPNFWHWKHLWGLGIYGRVSFFRYPILIFSGIFCPLGCHVCCLQQCEWLNGAGLGFIIQTMAFCIGNYFVTCFLKVAIQNTEKHCHVQATTFWERPLCLNNHFQYMTYLTGKF